METGTANNDELRITKLANHTDLCFEQKILLILIFHLKRNKIPKKITMTPKGFLRLLLNTD